MGSMRSKTYAQLKKELLRDRKIRLAYENFGPEFSVVAMIIKRRITRGLTQRELAKRVGTRQSAISRLESGSYNPSLSFLQKVSKALDARLEFSLSEK